MTVLLGVDIGTSAAKAVAIDAPGNVLGVASAEYSVARPRPGWTEQEPGLWWDGAGRAIRSLPEGVDRRAVAAIGLSGQMHGSVFLDRAGAAGSPDATPLRPALLWNDQRTAAQCGVIERAVGSRRRCVELVGNAAFPGFTLPKILWLREQEPEVFGRVAIVMMPKDFVALRMTGIAATDVGDASGTLLFDVDRREWSAEMARAVDLDLRLMPRALESAGVVGPLLPRAASELGLRPGIPVAIGSGDNMMGGVGAGVVESGMVLATLGTSGVIYAHSDVPRKDVGAGRACGRLHTMCAGTGHAGRPGAWCVTGCMLSAAGSLQWCRDALFPGVEFDALVGEAAGAPPGCEGLFFLPYLSGERCPHADPLARGGWIGLTARHGRGHLVRAVMEGVAFGMGEILDLVRGVGVHVGAARIGGGGARSSLWREMLGATLRAPIVRTNTEEGPALGAAILAGVGAGVWSDVPAAARAVVAERDRSEPDPVLVERYAPLRAVYAGLYEDLRERFAAIAALG